MKITQNIYMERDNCSAGCYTKSLSKKIILISENIMGKRRENVMRTITDRQVQNVVNKNNLQDSI